MVSPPPSDRRRIEDDERRFFARYYAEQTYHPVGWRLRLERDAALLRKASPAGRLGRVLSVGCGDGQFELLLAPFAERVTGIDLSPEAIAVAEGARRAQRIDNVEFRCLSFAELRWEESFDTIVCLAFLHHLPESELSNFLANARRHLRPGGIFYSQDPNAGGVLRTVGRRLMGSRYHAYHTPDERELDPDEMVSQLRRAGFGSVEVQFVDLTLIPALYLWKRGVAWPLRLAAAVDRAWCASPLARWASGFAVIARAA